MSASDWGALCAMYEMARDDAAEDVETDEEGSLLHAAHTTAMLQLLQTPAPDWHAFVHKLTVFRDEEAFELTKAKEVLELLVEDARRLARDL